MGRKGSWFGSTDYGLFFFLTITHPTGIMLVSDQGHKTYSAETGMIPALSSLTDSGSQEVV